MSDDLRIKSRALTVASLAGLLGILVQAQSGPAQFIPAPRGTHTETGLAGFAKILCSGVFVSERTPEDVVRGSAYFFMPRAEQDSVQWKVDRAARRARAPVGIEATFWGSSSPMRMIEPFPNCRSICETAASMALLSSNASSKKCTRVDE